MLKQQENMKVKCYLLKTIKIKHRVTSAINMLSINIC